MVTSFQLAAGKLIQARTETVNKFSQPPFLPRPMTGLAVLSAVAFPTKTGITSSWSGECQKASLNDPALVHDYKHRPQNDLFLSDSHLQDHSCNLFSTLSWRNYPQNSSLLNLLECFLYVPPQTTEASLSHILLFFLPPRPQFIFSKTTSRPSWV